MLPVDNIPAPALAAFHTEMQARQIDLADYELFFEETEDAYIVTAAYRHKPPGQRGSLPEHPDYDVTIDRKNGAIRAFALAR